MSATPASGLVAPSRSDAAQRMNRMYRLQRHIYDLTRAYYLLGRDRMIDGLKPARNARVVEIGCGTGRNLVQAAQQYPDAKFYGFDISTEMLASATSSIQRHGLTDRVRVVQGDATAFDTQALFGVAAFDAVFISYSLSMIPDWRSVLSAAFAHVNPGGRLHIVDFGQQERLPGLVRTSLMRWLALFDVTPRPDLERVLMELAQANGARLRFERPFRGYAQYAVLQRG